MRQTRRTGQVFKRPDGSWWARTSYKDPTTGKRRVKERRAKNKLHAQALVKTLLVEIDTTDPAARDGADFETGSAQQTVVDTLTLALDQFPDEESRKTIVSYVDRIPNEERTFADLCAYYAARYLRPAEYRDDQKTRGLRSLYTPRKQLGVMRAHFGTKRLHSIRFTDLEEFKTERLQAPHKYAAQRVAKAKEKAKAQRTKLSAEVIERLQQRSLTSVHRELALLNRIFTVAEQNDWVKRNPFRSPTKLISSSKEAKRTRVISRAEEERLLDACIGPRQHLRPLLICLIDTGMRFGEAITLKWRDVDLRAGLVTIRALNTKTLHTRQVPISDRLHAEFEAKREETGGHARELVFNIVNNIKSSFSRARDLAGIPDVRLHDLRHTRATRWVQSGLPLPEVGRLLGHTQPQTTYRYVNQDDSTLQRALEYVNKFNDSEAAAAEAVN